MGKIFLEDGARMWEEMGFLVDDRSVIGVSNSVVASDYKDANVLVAKFRQRRDRESAEDECDRTKLGRMV